MFDPGRRVASLPAPVDLTRQLERFCDRNPPEHARAHCSGAAAVAGTIGFAAALDSAAAACGGGGGSVGCRAPLPQGVHAPFRAPEDHRAIENAMLRRRFERQSGAADAARRARVFGIHRIVREGRRAPSESPPPGGRLDDVRFAEFADDGYLRRFICDSVRAVFPPRPAKPSSLAVLAPEEPEGKPGASPSPPVAFIDTRDRVVRWRVDTPPDPRPRIPAVTAGAAGCRPLPLSPFSEPTASNPGPDAVRRPRGLDRVLRTIERTRLGPLAVGATHSSENEEDEDDECEGRVVVNQRPRRAAAVAMRPRDRAAAAAEGVERHLAPRSPRVLAALRRYHDLPHGPRAAPRQRSDELHRRTLANRVAMREAARRAREAQEEGRRAAHFTVGRQQRSATVLGDHLAGLPAERPVPPPATVARTTSSLM